jgi:hypothetical protein
MHLVLHPEVYSDIDELMAYYERVATAQLAAEFYSNYDTTCSRPSSGRNLSRSSSVIFAA